MTNSAPAKTLPKALWSQPHAMPIPPPDLSCETHFRAGDTGKPRMRAPGFTLIELLATVVIVTVLALLMMPALGNLREISDRAECTSNLKLLGVATTQFFADRQWRKVDVAAGSNWSWWSGDGVGLAPYLPDKLLKGTTEMHRRDLICPALARMDNTREYANYASNSGLTFNSTKTVKSLTAWPASRVATFMDGGRGNRTLRTFSLVQAQSDYLKPSNNAVLGFPHNNDPDTCYALPSTGGKMNVVFLDGHIELMDRDIGPFDDNFWCSEKALK